jgi:hypothetical protein
MPERDNVSTRWVFCTIDVLLAKTATLLVLNNGRYTSSLSAAGMIFELSFSDF